MRLIAWFIGLLLAATTASAVLWRSLPAARSGDVRALAFAFAAALTAFVALALLSRILLRIYGLRAMARMALPAAGLNEANHE